MEARSGNPIGVIGATDGAAGEGGPEGVAGRGTLAVAGASAVVDGGVPACVGALAGSGSPLGKRGTVVCELLGRTGCLTEVGADATVSAPVRAMVKALVKIAMSFEG